MEIRNKQNEYAFKIIEQIYIVYRANNILNKNNFLDSESYSTKHVLPA